MKYVMGGKSLQHKNGDDDSGSKVGSLSSLSAATLKACKKSKKDTSDADHSAFAGHFRDFLKLMGKD